MSFGYIYKESNSLVKINTYTNAPTEEEINAELNEDNIKTTHYNNIGKMVQNWKFILPYICPKQYFHIANERPIVYDIIGCYDLSEFYKILNIYPHQITKDIILELYENEYPIKSSDDDKTGECLIAAIKLVEKGYDGAYNEFTKTDNKKFFLPTHADGLFDIKIYNATYAYFMCGDDKVDLDFVEGIFTLIDFTFKNPYFNAVAGFTISIKTDGDKLSYKQIYITSDFRRILHRFNNAYMINKLYSKNIALYCGSMWHPAFVCSIDDIVVLDKRAER